MGELVVPGQGQAFGQGVPQAGELQGPEDLDQVGSDLLTGPFVGARCSMGTPRCRPGANTLRRCLRHKY